MNKAMYRSQPPVTLGMHYKYRGHRMSIDNEHLLNGEQVQYDVQLAVESGYNIKEKIQRIAIKALTEGEIQSVKQVANAVMKGAKLGAESHTKEVIDDVIYGLDDALSKAVEVTKIALQGAMGEIEPLTPTVVKSVISDVQDLELLLVEKVHETAKNNQEQLTSILQDFTEHNQYKGTLIGVKINAGLKDLVEQLHNAGEMQLESSVESIKATGSILARQP